MAPGPSWQERAGLASSEMPRANDPSEVIVAVRHWLQDVVVDLNLCPFAGREVAAGTVRYVESTADREAALLADLSRELHYLVDNPAVETTLLIHPRVLQDFFDYNQFLDRADALLRDMSLEGEIQIASFHPRYQFAGTEPDAAENYSNRSPYPLLHLLREASVARAVAVHPNVARIPEDNIRLLNQTGLAQLQAMLMSCMNR